MQSQTDFILRSEPDTTITFANEALCRALGCSVEQVIGQKWIDFADPRDLDKVLQQISELSPNNPSFIVENRDRRADGQTGWTQWIDQGKFNDHGELIEIQSVGRDITALKTIETQLRESEARFQKIAEVTPSLIYIYDHIEQRNLYSNRSVAEVLGYSPEPVQAMGSNLFATICHPDDLPQLYEVLQKIQDLADDEVIELRYRVIDAQGHWHWLMTRGIVFLRTSEGRVWQTLGNSQDITQWIESENRLTLLARQIPGVIYQFRMRPDGSFHFPYASEGIKDIYGVNHERVQEDATPVLEILHPDDLEGVYQSILDSATNLTPWHYEYRVCLGNGHIIWVVGDSMPEREADGGTIWHGYIKDITERKRSEIALKEAQLQLQQANLELEKLANLDGLTHIANRRSFDLRLQQEWQRLHREQAPLSLLFFDVDYFKNYNDLYGHPQGDQCLIAIAQVAESVAGRSSDLVARIGGEEFAVILPNTDLHGAMAIAEKIRTTVQALGLVHKDSPIAEWVTISLGVSSQIPSSDNSPAIFMAEADKALYRAKQQGRNRVVSFLEIG